MLIPTPPPAVGDMPKNAPTVPEATYNLRIVKATMKQSTRADAKGPYLAVQAVITGPDAAEACKGRMIFQNYFFSEKAVWRLRELLVVTGHDENYKLTDTDELVNLEFGAAVTIKEGTEGYADQNQIAKHVPLV